jgi:hypothetical protein
VAGCGRDIAKVGARGLVGTFGTKTISVPRARIEGEDGKTTKGRSKALRAISG